MIILDTNVLSAVMQRQPPKVVIAWLNKQATTSVWTTAITVFEIEYGLRRLAKGKRQTDLNRAFQILINEGLGGRILPFDAEAALAAGTISAELESEGKRVDFRDVQIAGIARVRQAVVATRNAKHFDQSCTIVNPWEDN